MASNRPVQTLQDLRGVIAVAVDGRRSLLSSLFEELNGRDGPVGRITSVAFSSASRASGVPEDEASRPCQILTQEGSEVVSDCCWDVVFVRGAKLPRCASS